jgi:hypothetical protein
MDDGVFGKEGQWVFSHSKAQQFRDAPAQGNVTFDDIQVIPHRRRRIRHPTTPIDLIINRVLPFNLVWFP